jgi:hypothetical protein
MSHCHLGEITLAGLTRLALTAVPVFFTNTAGTGAGTSKSHNSFLLSTQAQLETMNARIAEAEEHLSHDATREEGQMLEGQV